ncbi:MAG: TIGR03750 family conjugal transfer protein [Pseudomonadales bacterium]|nr:TIGR03750 family conjugal transfer protein [Pseudomonadales bacterium]
MKEPGMNGREIEFIPDRLIEEPVVFRGLTDTEVVMIFLAGLVFWIPVSVILLIPFGWALFGVGIGFGMAIGSVLVAGNYLQSLKRRMPDGLHVVYLKKLAQKKFSFFNFGYIETSQSWDIRREKPVTKINMELEE